MVPDVSLFQPYLDVFTEIDEWQRNKNRKLEDVPKIVARFPSSRTSFSMDIPSWARTRAAQPTSTMRRNSRPRCRRPCGSRWNIALT